LLKLIENIVGSGFWEPQCTLLQALTRRLWFCAEWLGCSGTVDADPRLRSSTTFHHCERV